MSLSTLSQSDQCLAAINKFSQEICRHMLSQVSMKLGWKGCRDANDATNFLKLWRSLCTYYFYQLHHTTTCHRDKGSEEEENWRRSHPNGWKARRGSAFTGGSTIAHLSAQKGDALSLARILDDQADFVHAKDQHHWTPLHESIRAQCLGCIKTLVERGADVNAATIDGRTPLFFSRRFSPAKNHNNQISHFLEKHGARESRSELWEKMVPF